MGVSIEIFDWAESRNNFLSAAHIRGIDNKEADSLSRVTNVDSEWSLLPSEFGKLVSLYGSPKVCLGGLGSFMECMRHSLS